MPTQPTFSRLIGAAALLGACFPGNVALGALLPSTLTVTNTGSTLTITATTANMATNNATATTTQTATATASLYDPTILYPTLTPSSTDTQCPWANNQTYATPNGIFFLAACDTDHFGGDLNATYVNNYAACFVECSVTPGCVGFAFLPGTNWDNCYMKANVTTPATAKPGVWSGVVFNDQPCAAGQDIDAGCHK